MTGLLVAYIVLACIFCFGQILKSPFPTLSEFRYSVGIGILWPFVILHFVVYGIMDVIKDSQLNLRPLTKKKK